MTQKATPTAPSQDEPSAALTVPATGPVAGTAPEVPHAIAKQYNLHTEPLHQPPTSVPAAEADSTDTDTLATAENDAAVEDILNKESDELLDIQDAGVASQPARSRRFRDKVKDLFRSWWRNKLARYTSLIVMAAGLGAIAVIPTTRYGILNTVGVRSSASVIILDDATRLPLKNVTVSLNGQSVQTNRQGLATLRRLKLGKYELQVKRIAFASYRQPVTIGWGSNPLGKIGLRAVGTQYQIYVKDYLSAKPIRGAEAESDSVNALSDEKGKILLTVDDTSITSLEVKLNASGYRSETVKLDAASAVVTTSLLVPAQRAVYVSKASGKYDVYSSYIDGQDKKLILASSGLEANNIGLAISPDNKQAAVVSTRDNLRDRDGYLLFALTFINVDKGTSATVDHAQQLQLVDWLGDRLIYRSTIAEASAANPQRNRLIAYNFGSNSRVQLAAANQFNTILSATGYVYYAVSSTDPQATLGLFRIKPDNTGRERLISQEVWTAIRTGLDTLSLQTPTGWQSLDLDTKQIQKTGAPSDFASLLFTTRGDRTAWVDIRDNKGVLLLKNQSDNKVNQVVMQPGLTYPIYWLNDNALVYRVVTNGESADYAVSINGGAAHKIGEVTATNSYTQAY